MDSKPIRPADVEIIDSQTVYKGYTHLKRIKLKHELFNGGYSEGLSREIFERNVAVGVLLFDPQRNQIVLIEQFRVGVVGNRDRPWLVEIVAGVADHENESLEEVARRETQEETGLIVIDLLPIYRYWSSPGISTEQVQLFCGRVDAARAGGVYGLAKEGEDICSHVLDLQEAYHSLNKGEIDNASTIIALQWLQFHEQMVRKTWSE